MLVVESSTAQVPATDEIESASLGFSVSGAVDCTVSESSGAIWKTCFWLGEYTNIMPASSMLATAPEPSVSAGGDCASKVAMSPMGVIQTWPVARAKMTTVLVVRKTSGLFGGSGTLSVTVEVAGSTISSLLFALSTRRTVEAFCSTSRLLPAA